MRLIALKNLIYADSRPRGIGFWVNQRLIRLFGEIRSYRGGGGLLTVPPIGGLPLGDVPPVVPVVPVPGLGEPLGGLEVVPPMVPPGGCPVTPGVCG
jgi:hypothetical protein